jgi:hypothetical protein
MSRSVRGQPRDLQQPPHPLPVLLQEPRRPGHLNFLLISLHVCGSPIALTSTLRDSPLAVLEREQAEVAAAAAAESPNPISSSPPSKR